MQKNKKIKINILNEAGWATLLWKLNKEDKFHDGGAATCSLLVSCDALIDLPVHCLLYSLL